MPKIKANLRSIQTPKHRQVTLVALQGIISAPTTLEFRQIMAEPLEAGRDIVMDLGNVTYINSSGLGEFVRIHDTLEQKNLSLVVVNMEDEVGRLVNMLGLSSFLHVLPSAREALAALDEGFPASESKPESAPGPKMRGEAFVPVVAEARPRLPEARILLCINGDPHFERFLSLCLAGKDGNTVVVHSRAEAQEAQKAGRVDIAILESALPDTQAIVTDLKTRKTNGILPVILIYPDKEQRLPPNLFRICEDEYVEEPFEVRELVALAEAEYQRCRSESILFVQEASLEIATREGAIAEAHKVIEHLIHQAGLANEDADGFFYALREAIDNARRHGNKADESKMIEVLYVLDKEKITVTVGDEGPGFDYGGMLSRARDTSPIEQARERHKGGGYGGLGIGLMLRCCDKVEYLAPGSMLKLTKYL